jgi:hypothetical protein
MTTPATTPDDGSGITQPSNADTDADINNELAQMNAAFQLATAANTAITILKTIDGAVETASQQRPSIG